MINDLLIRLEELEKSSFAELENVDSIDKILNFKSKYLNKKSGELSKIMKALPQLSIEEKKRLGGQANQVKKKLELIVKEKEKELSRSDDSSGIDISQPGEYISPGYSHILNQVMDECVSILRAAGFKVATGPEVETDFHNFEALNIPSDHPARDMHDTFYVSDNIVMRTHTSPVQIRTMEAEKPPLAIISPGICYRSDTPDATHSPVFHQIEGLCVDEDINFADLKGILTYFYQSFFSPDIRLRFRPSFFPFTEPSTEVDISCIFCGGDGCRICKKTGWIEVAGAGLVDPEVFKFVNYDPEKYTGYAFGMGVERIAMLKYQVNDIRLFYENDLNFLKQF